MLGEKTLELEKDKEKPVQKWIQQSNRSMPKQDKTIKELIQFPSKGNTILSLIYQVNLNRQCDYVAIAAAQSTQISNQPWTKVSYSN